MSNLKFKLGHIISGLVAVSLPILTGITIDGGSVGLETNELSSIGSSLISGGGSLINLGIQLIPYIIAFSIILILVAFIYKDISGKFSFLNKDTKSNYITQRDINRYNKLSKNNFKYHNIQNKFISKSDSWKLHQMNIMAKNDPELTRINPILGFGYNYRLRKENGNRYVVYDTSPFGDTEYMTDYVRGSKFINTKYKEMKRYYNDRKNSK